MAARTAAGRRAALRRTRLAGGARRRIGRVLLVLLEFGVMSACRLGPSRRSAARCGAARSAMLAAQSRPRRRAAAEQARKPGAEAEHAVRQSSRARSRRLSSSSSSRRASSSSSARVAPDAGRRRRRRRNQAPASAEHDRDHNAGSASGAPNQPAGSAQHGVADHAAEPGRQRPVRRRAAGTTANAAASNGAQQPRSKTRSRSRLERAMAEQPTAPRRDRQQQRERGQRRESASSGRRRPRPASRADCAPAHWWRGSAKGPAPTRWRARAPPSCARLISAMPPISRSRRRSTAPRWPERKAMPSRPRSIMRHRHALSAQPSTATRRCSASAVVSLVLHHGDADVAGARIAAVGLLAREIAAGHDAQPAFAPEPQRRRFAAAVRRHVEPEEEAAGRAAIAVAVADDLIGEIEFVPIERRFSSTWASSP